MDTGSLVGLIKEYTKEDKDQFVKQGMTRWPLKDQIYEVEEMFKSKHGLWEISLIFYEFPGSEWDAAYFAELMAPGEGVIKQVEPQEELQLV